MFDEYAKKLKDLGANVPQIFKMVAKKGANHFETTAKELTDKEKAVDTGAYKRNWNADVVEFSEGKYSIVCMNTMEYASFLEDGYSIDKAHFVPFDVMQGSPKTQAFINSFKAKYPDAKGFMAKPRKFKGLKIGRRSMDNTEGWVLLELRNEIDIAMTQQKYGVSRKEAIKYNK